MRLIILAAGHGYSLDGMVKCLLKHPKTGRPFLEHCLEAFGDCRPTVVVGYRAVEIMHNYPGLDYIINSDWAVTSNSYSLGLALTDEPCFVCSSDLLMEPGLVADLKGGGENLVVVDYSENRLPTAINCRVDDKAALAEVYVGPLKNRTDPECTGIFKISAPKLLKAWKHNCLKHPNLFAAQTLPLTPEEFPPVTALATKMGQYLWEVNTPQDYLALLKHFQDGDA